MSVKYNNAPGLNTLLIVLTDNYFMYEGIVNLTPEAKCLQMNYSATDVPGEVGIARCVFILVDSLVAFHGEWTAFQALKKKRPDISTIWFLREETGRYFPVGIRGERMLRQKQSVNSLRNAITLIINKMPSHENDEYVEYVRLSQTEQDLLPFFMSGMCLHRMGRMTGKSLKTLYTHRRKILRKTGFRQTAFLAVFFKKNQKILDSARPI